jgi:hypothetical protein
MRAGWDLHPALSGEISRNSFLFSILPSRDFPDFSSDYGKIPEATPTRYESKK